METITAERALQALREDDKHSWRTALQQAEAAMRALPS